MGFMDSIKEALGGERDDQPVAPPEPRHVDRDAPEESPHRDEITGGKHAARD